jgi:hypothetical protein
VARFPTSPGLETAVPRRCPFQDRSRPVPSLGTVWGGSGADVWERLGALVRRTARRAAAVAHALLQRASALVATLGFAYGHTQLASHAASLSQCAASSGAPDQPRASACCTGKREGGAPPPPRSKAPVSHERSRVKSATRCVSKERACLFTSTTCLRLCNWEAGHISWGGERGCVREGAASPAWPAATALTARREKHTTPLYSSSWRRAAAGSLRGQAEAVATHVAAARAHRRASGRTQPQRTRASRPS